MENPLIELLLQRHSLPSRQLREPAPDAGQVQQMLHAAVHVPDHGRLAPWRFIELREEGRRQLGQALVDTYRSDHPEATDVALEKERTRFAFAPLVIVVVGCITPGHKVPVIEQQLSAGCVCLQLLQAATAMGFAAQWLTGWAAYHPAIHATLGLGANEQIIGFVHIGTPAAEAVVRPRPEINELLTRWPT